MRVEMRKPPRPGAVLGATPRHAQGPLRPCFQKTPVPRRTLSRQHLHRGAFLNANTLRPSSATIAPASGTRVRRANWRASVLHCVNPQVGGKGHVLKIVPFNRSGAFQQVSACTAAAPLPIGCGAGAVMLFINQHSDLAAHMAAAIVSCGGTCAIMRQLRDKLWPTIHTTS
jgi:hypothetical protein